MAAIAAKRNVLEMPGEFGASRARCQATFMNLIPEMRPHVISDLWNTALLEFEGPRMLRLLFTGRALELYR